MNATALGTTRILFRLISRSPITFAQPKYIYVEPVVASKLRDNQVASLSICVWKRISHRNRANKHPNPYTDKRKSHALRTDMEYFRHFIYPASICRCAPWASLHGFSPLYIFRCLVCVFILSALGYWSRWLCHHHRPYGRRQVAGW